MAVFPSTWDLLIPNWNFFTILGIIMIAVAILAFNFASFFSFLGVSKEVKKFAFVLFLSAIAVIWGTSILADFLTSVGGQVLFFGTLATVAFGVLLFWTPKQENGGGMLSGGNQ